MPSAMVPSKQQLINMTNSMSNELMTNEDIPPRELMTAQPTYANVTPNLDILN